MRTVVVLAAVLATAVPTFSQVQAQQLPPTQTPLITRLLGDLRFIPGGLLLPHGWSQEGVLRAVGEDRIDRHGFGSPCSWAFTYRQVDHVKYEVAYDTSLLPEPTRTARRRIIPLTDKARVTLEFWRNEGAGDQQRKLACTSHQWYEAAESSNSHWRAAYYNSTLGLRDVILRSHAPGLVSRDTVSPDGDGGRLELRDAEDNRLIMSSRKSCNGLCGYYLYLYSVWGPYARAMEAAR